MSDDKCKACGIELPEDIWRKIVNVFGIYTRKRNGLWVYIVRCDCSYESVEFETHFDARIDFMEHEKSHVFPMMKGKIQEEISSDGSKGWRFIEEASAA